MELDRSITLSRMHSDIARNDLRWKSLKGGTSYASRSGPLETETEDVKGLDRGFLLAGKDVLVTLLEQLFPGKLYRKQLYFIVTGAVLSIFIKSLFAGADVRSLGIVTHCVDVTIRWNWVGTLVYI